MIAPTSDSKWVPSKYKTQFWGELLMCAAGSEEKMNYCCFLFASNSNSIVNSHYLKTNIIPARQEIPAIYGNRIFITVFTTARHLSLIAFR